MLLTKETRERKFFKEFSQWSGLYVEALKSSDIKDFAEFNVNLLDATALFGLTEFYGRQLERTKTFKVTPQLNFKL